MKRIAILTMIIVATTLLFGQLPPIPDFYYDYETMVQQIMDWETQYPEMFMVKHIGYSQEDDLPIYAVKVSNNVQVNEDKPAILIVGSLHAEEIIGTEIVMRHLKDILSRPNFPDYRRWLQNLELWFIPNLNPEGWKVVTDGLDVTYRKNKRDNNNNGIFDFVPGMGHDIDGVDINRNFDFNWVHGDSLLEIRPGTTEPYDYYRGPYPMSEKEIHALLTLLEEQHFIYSVVWHSSRSGLFSEKVYHSFNWADLYPSPDLNLARSIGGGFASKIQKFNSSQYYESLDSAGRNGSAHDWFYKELGTIQLLAEAGTRNLQPQDENVLIQVVNECIKGHSWLFDRALNSHLDRSPMLTGNITDAASGEPLQAEVIVHEHHGRYFTPRLSDKLYGRYWRPLLAGTYTVTYRKEGYQTVTLENVNINNSAWTARNVNLQPLSETVFSGTVLLENSPVDAEIKIRNKGWKPVDYYTHTIDVLDGSFTFDTYEGEKEIIVTAEGAYPYIGEINLNPNTHQIQIVLSPKEVLFSEDWQGTTEQWVIDEPWQIINASGWEGGKVIIESYDGGRNLYQRYADVSIVTESPIDLTAYNTRENDIPMITFWQSLYTVWDLDYVYVDFSTDMDNWQTLYQNSGQFDHWHPVYVSLEPAMGEEVYLRFRFKDNTPVGPNNQRLIDPGWMIDNIQVIAGNSILTSVEKDTVDRIIPVAALHQNYPNPFNPETTISYSLVNKNVNEAKIAIYNIKGALVETITLDNTDINRGNVIWNAEKNSSGVYFYQLILDGLVTETKKAILMK